MSNLESITSTSTPARVDAALLDRASSPRSGGLTTPVVRLDADQLELSPEALALQSETPIRRDLVARIRAEIAAGTYDTNSRLDGAIDGLVVDLVG